MNEIVLLTSKWRDLQTRSCIEQLRSALGERASDMACGGGSWTELVTHLGPVRRACRKARVVHAWGYGALRLASFAATVPLIYTPLSDDPPNDSRWLGALRSRRSVTVVSLSGEDDRRLVSGGMPAESCNIVHPGVRMRRDLSRNVALRRKLGLGDDHVAVLAVGESERHSDHLMTYHVLSILHQIDARYTMVIWGRGTEVGALLRLQEEWKSDSMVNVAQVQSEASHEEVISACDLALLTAPGRLPLLPVLQCMAGNLPIVAPATREISEVLEDRHTAFLFSPLKPRVASQRLLAAAEDVKFAKQIADQARAEAYELYPVSTFVSKMLEVYERVGQLSGK